MSLARCCSRKLSMKTIGSSALGAVLLGCLVLPQHASGQATTSAAGAITTPKKALGFNVGDDYCLANFQQLKSYWEKLERESDRIKLVEIGRTEEGRPQIAAIVTSRVNHRRL